MLLFNGSQGTWKKYVWLVSWCNWCKWEKLKINTKNGFALFGLIASFCYVCLTTTGTAAADHSPSWCCCLVSIFQCTRAGLTSPHQLARLHGQAQQRFRFLAVMHLFVGQFPGKACAVHMGANRYVWEEDPCQEHAASLIFRQVLFCWVHKQFSGSLEVVHFTRLFKDLWHLRRAGEANNPTFRTWVFPQRSILDRNIK